MNILDFASNTEEEEILKANPQTYNVLGSVLNNAVQGNSSTMSYSPTQSGALAGIIPEEQAQLANEEAQVQAQEQVVGQQEKAVQQEAQGETSFLKGLADGFANVFTNPDVLTSLNSFGAAMAGDVNSYNQYQNAYAERMEQRSQQRAAAQQKQRDNVAADRRAMLSELYKTYSPESVAEFQRTGDYGVLKFNVDKQLDIKRASTEDRKFDHQVSTDNRDYQFKSLQADMDREESAQERLDKGKQNAIENAQRDRSTDIQQQNADLSKQEKQAARDSASKEKWENAESVINTGNQTLDAVNNLLGSDYLDSSFGSIQGRLPTITENSQFIDTQLQNLASKLYINGVQDMKGLGSLSNAEGARISAAAAQLFDAEGNINYKISDKDARKALGVIRDIVKASVERQMAVRDSYKAPDYATDPRYQSAGGNAGSASTGAPAKTQIIDGKRYRGPDGSMYVGSNGKLVPAQ